MNDLIERLAEYKVGAHDGPPLHPPICDEAAKTIQELREQLAGRDAQIKAYQVTLDVLNKSEVAKSIRAGLEDIVAGRTRSLSCIDGGCERDELRSKVAALEADKERLDSGRIRLPITDNMRHVWVEQDLREAIDDARAKPEAVSPQGDEVRSEKKS